ncbi:MAG: hypothetical protein ACR2LR_05540 [Hassallia sp.]
MKRKVSKRDRLKLIMLVLAIAFILTGIIPGRIAIAASSSPKTPGYFSLGKRF